MPPPPEFVVAMTEDLDAQLKAHLDRDDGEEDLTFATWAPGTGVGRCTAILRDLILPGPGDRERHGNVHLNHPYLERAAALAKSKGLGLALLHSHPRASKWQRLSPDDAETEGIRIAPYAGAVAGLPLVGLTLSTASGFWSARQWRRYERRGNPSTYQPDHAMLVKVVGKRLRAWIHPDHEPPKAGKELLRTVTVWGPETQATVSRLRFAVVGLGSVGSIISEALARIGARDVLLIDHDVIKPHNRDRTLHATSHDAAAGTNKAQRAANAAAHAATMAGFHAYPITKSVVTPDVARQLLDCDVIFSCVDRPWPRHVLNTVAYAHLVPVIDGGIVVRFRNDRFDGMDWRTQTAGPGRACLVCSGGYAVHMVGIEREGLLDDPTYIQGMANDPSRPRSENIFPLSLGLASQELIQLVHLLTGLKGFDDVGIQTWHYSPPFMESTPSLCHPNCSFPSLLGVADAMPTVTGNIPTPKETQP